MMVYVYRSEAATATPEYNCSSGKGHLGLLEDIYNDLANQTLNNVSNNDVN
jgi:hypothetical protein